VGSASDVHALLAALERGPYRLLDADLGAIIDAAFEQKLENSMKK
jgi:hypothetical protein